MALGTDVSELNEVPGTGTIAGTIQVPVKIPGSARGVMHRVPASRLPGNGTPGGATAVALALTAAQALITASNVQPGTFYAITAPDWNKNTTATPATVYVFGETSTSFKPTGSYRDSFDIPREVAVDVAAGTFDTKPIRDLQLFQASDVDAQGQVELWLGEAATPDAVIKEVLL